MLSPPLPTAPSNETFIPTINLPPTSSLYDTSPSPLQSPFQFHSPATFTPEHTDTDVGNATERTDYQYDGTSAIPFESPVQSPPDFTQEHTDAEADAETISEGVDLLHDFDYDHTTLLQDGEMDAAAYPVVPTADPQGVEGNGEQYLPVFEQTEDNDDDEEIMLIG